MSENLQNKVILILGGMGGIGNSIADLLEREGAKVMRHGLVGEYAADVTDSRQTNQLIENILGKFGKIDVLVNSLTAPLKIGGIEKKAWNDFQTHFNVQLRAAVETANILVPKMKAAKSGQFINILSSVVTAVPRAIYPDYVTAKYALLGFSKALNEEMKAHGVFVNCISPDFIKTDLTKNFPEKLSEMVAAKNESGRLTIPEDVAKVVSDLIKNPGPGGKNIIIAGGLVKN